MSAPETFFRRWSRVSRANFLPTSLLPYCLGAAFAFSGSAFRPVLFLIGLFGAGTVHSSANLFNEYWDWRFAADRPAGERSPHYGGSGAIQAGAVRPGAVLASAWVTLASALVLGAGLALVLGDILLLLLVAAGSAIAWAYTAPPLRLVYRGGGEAALWLAFGPLLTGGGYLLAAGTLPGPALLLSLGPGFMIAALLTANEFGDTADDARAGKNNLVVRAGPRWGLYWVVLFLGLAFAPLLAGVPAGLFPSGSLLVLVALIPEGRGVAELCRAGRGEGSFSRSSRSLFLAYNLYHLLLIAGMMLP